MIWVVGASGMLGHEVCQVLTENNLPFVGSGHSVDIRERQSVNTFAAGRNFDWVVNCAAYTAVDRAESEPEAARLLNTVGPTNLATWCSENGATLVHISTDYVFAGDAHEPYYEDDQVNPQSVYGQTKAEGEAAVRSRLASHFILRTAWLYGQHGPNFVATMLRLMNEKSEFGVVDDQRGAPTWARDLAHAIVHLMGSEQPAFGTYHVSDEGQTTWFGFAQEILVKAQELGLVKGTPLIRPLTTADYPTKAVRPAWSVLSKQKLKTVFDWSMPDWKESLSTYLRSITTGNQQKLQG